MENKLQNILTAFGKKIDLPHLSFDESGHCPLQFDEETFVNLQIHHSSGNLLMFSTVGTIEKKTDESVLLRLLTANAFWQETAGATLSIVNEGTVLLAQQTAPDAISLASFEIQLESFVNAVKYWSAYILQQSSSITPPQQPITTYSPFITKRA